MREEIFRYVKKKYKVEPDYPFPSVPFYPVLRHKDNRKLFAIIMEVSKDKLGLDGTDYVDIINVKLADPLLADMLSGQPGYFHGYHLRQGNWISILLDGTVPLENICRWIDESYVVTASKQKRQKYRPPKEWLVPANPKYYDIEHAFDHARRSPSSITIMFCTRKLSRRLRRSSGMSVRCICWRSPSGRRIGTDDFQTTTRHGRSPFPSQKTPTHGVRIGTAILR